MRCSFEGSLANLRSHSNGTAETPADYTSSISSLTTSLDTAKGAMEGVSQATNELVTTITTLANNGISLNNINDLYTQMVNAIRNGVAEAYANVPTEEEAGGTADESTTVSGEITMPVTIMDQYH